MASEYRVVLTTAPGPEEARHLARCLVEERLAACVQVMPINSVYRWQGEVQEDGEVLLLAKTRQAGFEVIRDRITALHPYSVPEILCLPIADGNAPYLQWLDAVMDGEAD